MAIANRNLISDAVRAWQSLSEKDRLHWNAKAYASGLTGFNRFIKNYLKKHGV